MERTFCLEVGLLSEVNKYLYLIFPLKFKKDGNMQLKFAGIESLILCTIACFQISFTKRPQCSSFAMKFFGSLREDRAKLLWDIEKESLVSVMHACFPRCEKDQRCVGVEVCTIRPDLWLTKMEASLEMLPTAANILSWFVKFKCILFYYNCGKIVLIYLQYIVN